ncbi:1,4-dihydroxy-2-naphthoate octaprenyltransferase [Sungkyunkwania multivorans]|uniref:1,4-dihydroxy-2-naphthoate octaprenyltransferase n=1 Tax=Sungkyunkwania multivorans TaxID=1173618 RepID=A0ABW3CXL1_9FLAO
MPNVKAWLSAARLRTLPLSISGIIAASGVAASQGYFDSTIFILALLTTIGFQVLSNFANDYGDGVKGTDNEERIGPVRALQSGAISAVQMRTAMVVTVLLTLLSALVLIYVSFGTNYLLFSLLFIVLGIASIIAAIKYTVGDTAYGYNGLGDVFVFLFFGLLSVLGTYFLYAKVFFWELVLLASAVGLLSVAVLNLNNMRDMEGDKRAGKNTLVVKMGAARAKKYHYALILVAFLCLSIFLYLVGNGWKSFLVLLAFVPLIFHLKRVGANRILSKLDGELKVVALSTFFITLLLSVIFNIFS